MRIKKIIFAVFISLFLVVTLAINCFGKEYDKGAFGVDLVNYNNGSTVGTFTVYDAPFNYPLGAANYLNVLDYVSSPDFKYYVDSSIPDNGPYQFNITFPPMSAQGNVQGDLEEYVNEISATLGICLTQSQYNQFANYLVLKWGGEVLETINSVQLTQSKRFIFNISDINGTSQIEGNIYFLKIKFKLYNPIAIDDLWGRTFTISILAPNPAQSVANYTYYQGLHYQFAMSDLYVQTATLDDVVSEIGSRLDNVNNNLLVLQGLNQEILDALRQNGYNEEVQDYIDNIKDTINKTDDLASRENEIWGDISFGNINHEVDLGFFSNMSWLWNDWIIMIVVSLCAIATISYGLFGGS